MTDKEFQVLIEDSVAFLRARIAAAQGALKIGEFERYDYDLESCRFWWSDAGVAKIEAKALPVGSYSTSSKTWLWAWANPSLHELDLSEIERVRAFGEEHQIGKLVERKWPASEEDGWEMCSVAARLLEADGAYRSPSKNGPLFLLLFNLRSLTHEGKKLP